MGGADETLAHAERLSPAEKAAAFEIMLATVRADAGLDRYAAARHRLVTDAVNQVLRRQR